MMDDFKMVGLSFDSPEQLIYELLSCGFKKVQIVTNWESEWINMLSNDEWWLIKLLPAQNIGSLSNGFIVWNFWSYFLGSEKMANLGRFCPKIVKVNI